MSFGVYVFNSLKSYFFVSMNIDSLS